MRGLRRRAIPFAPEGAAAVPFPLYLSPDIAGAAVVGVRRPVILVGPDVARGPAAALQQVLVHEAAHARRRDPLWSLAERLVHAAYWYHPLVLLCRRELARAREEACDDPVLARFAPADYARTLLALAAAPARARQRLGQRVRTPPSPAASAACSRRRPASRPPVGRPPACWPPPPCCWRRAAGRWCCWPRPPRRHALASRSGYRRCRPPRSNPPALEFAAAGPRAQGAFVLKEVDGPTVVINRPLAELRLTPASTFKLLIGLLGLESGAIPDAHTVLRWNGQPQGMPAWNRDHDLASAMRTSATWYFEDVLDHVDPAAVQTLLQRLRYGNQDARGSRRRFWLEGPLRISAVEQAEALARLVAGESGASKRSLGLLAEVTELGRDGQGVLYGKTGTAVADGQTVAWLVGGVRRGERRHTYALVMLAPEADGARLQQTRRGITEALLARHGVFGPSR